MRCRSRYWQFLAVKSNLDIVALDTSSENHGIICTFGANSRKHNSLVSLVEDIPAMWTVAWRNGSKEGSLYIYKEGLCTDQAVRGAVCRQIMKRISLVNILNER